ncbi:DNA-directed RNA polymerase III subunit RPC5-like [Trichogramma pretiosum]|uniref:DNA-directed RNA polymerase III subunit RPC5-like n=1 Tax=Trichogramma pretiosum TaxID=7493 RepID=UPI0006C9485C|nr:DNA-directed RNA polymerase III subunit RPC5-like [Trichogramma pretiosum]
MFKPKVMEEEDDPVVKEIPVYLSKRLEDNLFIFQYPLKSAQDGYDDAIVKNAAIKIENQEVKLDVMLDTTSINYDEDKAEEIADLSKDQEEKIFDVDKMDKISLTSSRVTSKYENYAIGVFQNNELHLTPLKGFIQLRPDFSYLDDIGKPPKSFGKNDADGSDDELLEHEVHAKFARPVPDYVQKKREQSFETHAKKSMEETWIPSEYISKKTNKNHQIDLTRMEMFCEASDDSVNDFTLTKKQYLDLIAPPIKKPEYAKADVPSPISTLSYIRTRPLIDQVRLLMKDAKIMSFEQLKALLSAEHQTTAILRYLQQVAYLVQGNWVVNSELIYPKDAVSSHSGIPAELMCRARDYILLCFTESEFVDRRAVSSVVKMPVEEVREILNNLAKHVPKKGWKLIINPSLDFVKKYPEVAHRQALFWETRGKQLREIIESHHNTPQRKRR